MTNKTNSKKSNSDKKLVKKYKALITQIDGLFKEQAGIIKDLNTSSSNTFKEKSAAFKNHHEIINEKVRELEEMQKEFLKRGLAIEDNILEIINKETK